MVKNAILALQNIVCCSALFFWSGVFAFAAETDFKSSGIFGVTSGVNGDVICNHDGIDETILEGKTLTIGLNNGIATVTAQPHYGYDLLKWEYSNKAGKYSTTKKQLTVLKEGSETPLQNLEAFFTTATVCVTFNANGGSPATQPLSGRFSEPYPKPTEPTRTGYTFVGWFTEKEGGTQISPGETPITRAEDHTIYAHWTGKTYIVTFEKQGGSGGTDSVTATYGSAMPTITPPNRTGCNFTGYYDQPNGAGTKYYTADGSSAHNWDKLTDATLYANWTYTVTLDKQGGSGGTDSVTATYGSAMPTPITLPSRTGYDFAGYYDQPNGAGTQYYDKNGNSAHNWDKLDKAILYANWTGKPYTVTLGKQGGSGGTDSVTATYGSAMPTITPPNRTGCNFTGYYDQPNGAGTKYYTADGSSAHNWDKLADATLYANWTYTVTLDKQGGSGGTDSVTATYGSAMPTPITLPSRTGYDFAGYYDQPNGAGTQYYDKNGNSAHNWDIAANATLYAAWDEDRVTLTINFGEGIKEASYSNETTKGWIKYESEPPLSFLSGTWVNIAGTPVTGYKSSFTKSNPYSLQIVCNTNIYLTATPRDYIVELDPDGGECDESSITCRQGQEVGELPLPAREGHTFKGWRAEDNSIVNPETPYDSATMGLTFTADWVRNKYTLTTGVNDATLGSILRSPEKNKYDFEAEVNLYAIAELGAVFYKWSDNLFTTNRTVTIGTDNTYTAYFSNLLFIVSFDGNGAKAGSMAPQVTAGTNWLTLATNQYIYPGHTFLGWRDNISTNDLVQDGAQFNPNLTNHLLTAAWSTNTYTIVFNGNHYRATGSMPDLTDCLCDVVYELPTNLFTRPAADFLGWATNSASTTVDFTNGTSVVNLTLTDKDTVFLYAVWAMQTNDLTLAAHAVNVKLTTRDEETFSVDYKPWTPVKGGSGIQSFGHLGEFHRSILSATLTGVPGTISFRWRYDCLDPAAQFVFKVGNDIYGSPKTSNWEYVRFYVNSTSLEWAAAGNSQGCLYLDDVRWIPFQETEYDWARTYHPKGASATDAECNAFLYNNWSKYVAGCDPTDSNSVFRVKSFTLTNGVVNLEWEPDLSDFTPPRDYLIFGKTNITDAAWHSPTNSESRFFKVEVEMR